MQGKTIDHKSFIRSTFPDWTFSSLIFVIIAQGNSTSSRHREGRLKTSETWPTIRDMVPGVPQLDTVLVNHRKR